MTKPSHTRRNTLLWAAAALAICLVTEYVQFGLANLDWSVPLLYGGDGISGVQSMRTALNGGADLLGWPYYQPPAGTNPNYDLLYDLYAFVVGLFTDNFALAFNLYVLVIPPINTLVAYSALRSLKVRGWLACAGAVTFGLCPYVQQRLGGHMGLAAVECIPLVLLLCLWCTEDERFNRPGQGFFRYYRNWLSLAFAWAIANNGMVYYPYFGCFLLCITALCLLLRNKQVRSIISPLITIAEIVAWLALGFLPMVYGLLSGTGSTITAGASRGTVGPDIYGLRISTLFLSDKGFGFQIIADAISAYKAALAGEEGVMYNENSVGYLGIVGIIGFLLLLLWLFMTHRQSKSSSFSLLSDRLWLFSRMNIAMLLLATISGFGALIGTVLRMLRGYTRITPYIAFLSILTVILLIESGLTNITATNLGKTKSIVATAITITLLGYGYWEQQGYFNVNYSSTQALWVQDEAFVQQIEETSGEEAMIYQLPYMKSFENGTIHKMSDYTLLRGTLHSDTLRWSYGAPYGSENDIWNQTTSQLEPASMVAELKEKGFAGIYLDRDGYEDDTLEQTLSQIIGCTPIVSGSGTLVYLPFE